MVIAILFGAFFLLMFLGVPISFAIGLSSIASVLFLNLPLELIAQRMMTGIDSFSLMAIPFFVLAGSLMNIGGIAQRLLKFANCLVGFMRGGLAMVNIVASMFFGGISGSSVADTVAIGTPLIPSMHKQGYDLGFSAAVTASSSTIGVIIPPSIPMIVVGVTGGVSIGTMFIAGIIPGIMMGLVQMITTYILALKHPEQFPKGKFTSLTEFWRSFKDAILALILPLIILGGIIGGVVTPTEVAVIAVLYSFIVGAFVYKELKLSHLGQIIKETISGTASVMFLVGTASLFGWVIAYAQVPVILGEWIQSLSSNPVIIILIINFILIIVGMFMDMTASIIILTPVLLPIAMVAGMNPINFGIMMVINLAIGLSTPPVGLCLSTCCNIAKISLARITKSVVPLLVSMLIVLLLVSYVPQITMLLPNLLVK